MILTMILMILKTLVLMITKFDKNYVYIYIYICQRQRCICIRTGCSEGGSWRKLPQDKNRVVEDVKFPQQKHGCQGVKGKYLWYTVKI